MYDGYKEPSDEEREELVNQYEKLTLNENSPFFDTDQYEQIIEFYLQGDQLEKAEEVINRAVDQHPSSTSLLLHRAQLLIFKGNTDEAVRIIDYVKVLEPYNPEVYMLLGNAMDEIGKYDEAIELYSEALKYDTDKDDVLLYMAYTFENADRYPEAIKVLKEALAFNPDNMQALSELAFCCDFSDNYLDSKAFLEDFIDKYPYSYMAWYCLGVIQYRMELLTDAIVSFDYAAIINPEYIPAQLNMGNIYFVQEKYELSIECFKKILDTSKDDIFALCYIANCYKQLDNNRLARNYYKKAIEVDARYSDAWYGIGCTYQGDENHALAVDYFKKAIDLSEDDHTFWYALADSYSELNEPRLAYKAYDKALELDNKNPEYWIGFVLFLRDYGFEKEAVQMAKSAIDFIEDPGLDCLMAGISIEEGKLHEAVFYLVEAKEQNEKAREEFEEMFPQLRFHYLLDEIFGN